MIYVYCGPTLPATSSELLPEAVFLPPVAQGDVYRLTARKPWAIGIIDGYFERLPSVTHKEILRAMSEGIHVYGAASMGALRAAELDAYGMVGVGGIFEAYRDGVLEDDDEVAVAHGSERDGFRAGSEAMVNIRATFDRAECEGVVSAAENARLQEIGKALFYPQRHYAAILEAAAEEGIAIEGLRTWLPAGRVDQKREDALELLRVMREQCAQRPEPKRVTYTLSRSEMWESAMQEAVKDAPGLEPDAETARLLDEVRLLGAARYGECRDGALLRALAREQVERAELPVENGNCLHLLRQLKRDETAAQLFEELRVRGIYDELAERAREKRRVLEESGGANTAAAGVTQEQLLAWHFARLGQPAPDDLAGYAQELDLEAVDMLVQLLLREYLFNAQS